ncbi:MAG: multicopper oxidase domain-containing protein [Desulfobulbaceae bacterium]|nr:multicopper oxidase domain-containing protein [Desulfobulbaceae bacterium]
MKIRPKYFPLSTCQILLVAVVFFFFASTSSAKIVEYNLIIDQKTVNFAGQDRQALAINGQIPGPTLYFDEGDKAIIRVQNNLDEETSIHWHGILLPNQYDGVPYVTTMPILPGKDHTFTFELKHSGTYWYHSHTNLQEQQGLYGSIVIQPMQKKIQADHDLVLLLSDWTDENPMEVLRTLKRGSEWYSIRKGTAQSWNRIIANDAVLGRLKQSFVRMPPMDVSDVFYDAFLMNGQPSLDIDQFQPGETIRLRVINGAAASYFTLQYAKGFMQLISADGMDVEPIRVKQVPIAIAETYDFLLTVPENVACEFRATAKDGSGYSSAFIGTGRKVAAPDIPPPNPYTMMGMMDHGSMSGMHGDDTMQHKMGSGQDMKHEHNMKHGMKGMQMESQAEEIKEYEIFAYSQLRSPVNTRLPEGNPVREVVLELTGNMDRYIWSFNNITLAEADKILIRQGENVRFKLVNKTMMSHPMHLHGHFFRVLNGQGDHAPLKHTVDVPPMATTVFEFLANEEKDWFFHCHILYHMMGGMARVVHYEGSVIDPALEEAKKASKDEMFDSDFFAWGEADIMSHMNAGELLVSNTRNGLGLEWNSDWQGDFDAEPYYTRYLSRFLSVFAGGEFSKEDDELETRGTLGVRYVLPLYIESEVRYDTENDWRLTFGSELQLFPRLFFHWSANTDDEWSYSLEWMLTKQVSFIANHDSDYDAGIGMRLRF